MDTRTGNSHSFWARMGSSLAYRNFRLLIVSSVVEHYAEFIEIAAVLWLTYQLTDSPLWLTVVGACRSIPMIVLSAWGGVIADRVDRRTVLIHAINASGLLALVMAALIYFNVITVWHIVAITMGHGITQSFNHPARHALTPNTVPQEQLLNALTLDNISVHAARLAAMPVAGISIAAFGVAPLLIVKFLISLLSIGIIMMTRQLQTRPSAIRRQTQRLDLAEGVAYVRHDRTMLALLLLYLVPMLAGSSYINFLPVYANDILNVGASGYGFLQAAPGLGAILTVLAIAFLTSRLKKGRLLFTSAIALGMGLVAFAVSPWMPLSLALLVAIGAFSTIYMTVNNTMVQSRLPDQIRGRVMSLREIAMGLGPSGGIFFGYIAQVTSIPLSLVVLGLALVLLCSIFLTTMKRVTNLD